MKASLSPLVLALALAGHAWAGPSSDGSPLGSPTAAVCGDGLVEGGEACDDGNTAPGDCCSATCQFEATGSACTPDGSACTTDTCDATGSCVHSPGNGGTVCRGNGAPAGSLVSGVASVPAGTLPIPVGISKFWFSRVSSPCGSDAAGDTSHHVRLYPTGSQNGETITNAIGCAGWHTFTDYPASATRLRNILIALRTGAYVSPATEADATYFNFTGGSIATTFLDMQSLYNARKDSSGVWKVLVPVYDSADCANPSSAIRIVGFATARIYSVNGTNKTIDANVDCDVIDVGAPPASSSSGGMNFGTQVASPGYCDVAEYCEGASSACPVDIVRAAGSACADDGNTCTTDSCDGGGSCLHAAGNAGVVCRAAAGICDTAETCPGTSTSCPADSFAATGLECRGATGACDVAEVCSGDAADCPVDQRLAAASVCRPASGICDIAETCDGSNADCPSDSFVDANTVCRPSAGSCDAAESCTGSASSCPNDAFLSSSTVCRPAAGICDQAESCSGSGAGCPVDVFLGTGTPCRAAMDACDAAETCDGHAANCPADAFLPSSTVCRSAAGICDQAETCTGLSGSCPVDGFLPSSVQCRATAGICDVAENCTGTSAACAADLFLGNGIVCRASAGVCDTVETCEGSAASCPADAFLGSATVCRASAGICDKAETCTGSTSACPADGFLASTVLCRATAGVCDLAERCSGSSAACPTDDFATSSSVCRGVAGVCDVAERCTGNAAGCPVDLFAAPSTVCRTATGVCDPAETCSGGSASCPSDARFGSTTTCRAASGECDLAEACNGLNSNCPSDSFASDATACTSDGERCTDDHCDGTGACAHSPIPLAPACYWAVVGGSDTTTSSVRTRGESTIGGSVCADSADIGDSSSLDPAGSWALLASDSLAARVRPGAGLSDGSIATGGGCITGLRGSQVFGTTFESVCCEDGDIALPNGDGSNVIHACGLHPLIDRCTEYKAQVPADVALLDSLVATQDLGLLLIEVGATRTIALAPGVNVVEASKLAINDGGTLRIDAQGDPDAVLVLRLGRGMKTKIGARIELTGMAQPSRVLFYAVRGGCLVGWQNQGAGTLFCPEGKVRMMVQTSWTGAIVAGSGVDVGWGTQLTHVPFLGLAQ